MHASYDLGNAIERHDLADYRKIASLMSLKHVQKSIDSVADLLSVLREHLNGFAPVHRLPPELLSLIFDMVSYIPRRHGDIFNFVEVESEYTRAPEPSGGLLTITHVCKRWRAVALRTPTLWTSVGAHPASDQLRAYMERSSLLPLSLLLSTNVPHLQDSLSSVGPRLRRLDLAINGPEEEDIDPSILRIDAPSIRCATFMCSQSYFTQGFDAVLSTDVEWVELFGQQKSPLEALALALATNWLPSNTFTQLTHLLLACNQDIMHTPRTGLLTLLANAPRLEFLHLIGLWYSGTDGIAVALDHLKSLEFDETGLASVLLFCARLLIPASTPIALLNVPLVEDEPLSPRLDESSPITSLAIYSSRSTLQFSANSAVREYLLHTGDDVWYDIIHELNGLLSLSSVTSLTVAFEYLNLDLVPLLQSLHQVSDLQLHISGYEHELQEAIHSIGAPGHDRLLPALSSFTISLRALFTFERPLLDAVSHMLRSRALVDPRLPVRRAVVQLGPGPGRSPAARVVWMDYVRKNFAPHVEEFEVREAPRPLERQKHWMVQGAEKYWALYDRAKPEYLGPDGRDLSGNWTDGHGD